MLPVEFYHHLNHVLQEREGELVVEDSDPSWGLGLLDTEGLELIDGEFIGPPV